MTIDLEIALLRTFVAVVDTGGLTSAGRRVGRTQPAITHSLNRLRAAFDDPLFVHNGRTPVSLIADESAADHVFTAGRLWDRVFGTDRRRLTLTSDGEVLLHFARALLKLTDEARARFSAPLIEGSVTLGTPDLYAPYILPEILRRFSRTHPNVEIELRCTRSVHLYAALAQGELDLALMTDQPDFARGEVVRQEPAIWVAGSQTEPEIQTPVPLAMLPAGSVYRHLALEALRAAGRPWSVVSVCDSIAGLQAAVFAGLAISIFPECAIVPGIRPIGRAEGFPSLPAINLVLHRKPQGVSEAAEQLAQFISREIGAITPFGRGPAAKIAL